MARPARPWFRFYVEAFGDRKLLRLTPAQRWLWVAVLGAARESCEPGSLMVAEGEPMTVIELARYADVPVDDVWPALEQMRRYGMVEWDESGRIAVCNWSERQFESDNTAVRTSKHRSQERSREHPNVVPGNGSEAETETEKETRSADASFASDFAAWWEQYPRKVQKAAAFTAYKARRRDGTTHATLVGALEHYAVSVAGVEQRFVMHASRFLNGKAGPWSEWVDGPPEGINCGSFVYSDAKTTVGKFAPEVTRAVLGRGPDAPPVWDLDEQGNAVVPAC